MPEHHHFSLTVAERVGTLTLSNPPVNALSRAVLEELRVVLDEIGASNTIKALVLTGADEKAFAAGADIRVFADRDTGPDALRQIDDYIALGQQVLLKLDTLTLPVIAAINGVCLGGGLELALACDMRYAAEHAQLGAPEINLGLIPGWGATQRLPQVVGPSRALELILTGEPVSATQALQIGLVSRVVPSAELLSAAQALAHTIAGRSRVAVTAAMRAVAGSATLPLEAGLALEREEFAKTIVSDDAREGITAFLEKRRPQFKDR